jgi:TusA-related sulfurtransferase
MNGGIQDDDLIHEFDHIKEIDNLNITINSPITKEEIEKAIKKQKNEKSSAEDQMVNEYLKHSFNTIVLLRDVFHIGLVIGPRSAVLA